MRNEQLSKQIEKKRADLIEIVKKEGLSSSLAIQYSQELDRLLNQYIRIDMKSNKQKYPKSVIMS
ncbi:Spo0E family sporulation regulatory protein-aspartic acid phosphatase [Heyndrickxia sp. NPDC080065]|uniref:Spo0E family sporulation regulatory protein-aspartic acid phosphatase n=1 Tax=Heyndrickxia sp. NPDC080065 TaxID=3390568 RepID=UPI003D077202